MKKQPSSGGSLLGKARNSRRWPTDRVRGPRFPFHFTFLPPHPNSSATIGFRSIWLRSHFIYLFIFIKLKLALNLMASNEINFFFFFFFGLRHQWLKWTPTLFVLFKTTLTIMLLISCMWEWIIGIALI